MDPSYIKFISDMSTITGFVIDEISGPPDDGGSKHLWNVG
jgi:hypothetical protein